MSEFKNAIEIEELNQSGHRKAVPAAASVCDLRAYSTPSLACDQLRYPKTSRQLSGLS
jgi:hypothetical protein